jgi:hypothetical protein
MSAPRAALFAAPALIVLAGSYLIAQHAQSRGDGYENGAPVRGQETVVWVSEEDEERMHRIALKQEAATDLLEGRLTLDETVQRFIDVSAGTENPFDNDVVDPRERFLMQVIAHIRTIAYHWPGRYDSAVARIVAEAGVSADVPFRSQ